MDDSRGGGDGWCLALDLLLCLPVAQKEENLAGDSKNNLMKYLELGLLARYA